MSGHSRGRLLAEDEKTPFWEDLVLIAVPAIIAIIPDLLEFFCDSDRKSPKKPTKAGKDDPPKAESFAAYVLSRDPRKSEIFHVESRKSSS